MSAVAKIAAMLETTLRQGINAKSASIRGATKKRSGPMPMASIASTSSDTCIVPSSAVNEAPRLETLTKKFSTHIVSSEEFTTYCGCEWEELGRESLRGINAPIAVFRPAASEREAVAPHSVSRSKTRDFSDAEAVVLLYRDTPA